MVTDGLTLWTFKEKPDGEAVVYLGNPEHPDTHVLWCRGPLAVLVEQHNRQVEWARTTLLAEKAAGRPTLSAAEIEAALTRMAVRIAVEVAKSLGPVQVIKWAFRSWHRRAPRPPAAAPMTSRTTPPAA